MAARIPAVSRKPNQPTSAQAYNPKKQPTKTPPLRVAFSSSDRAASPWRETNQNPEGKEKFYLASSY
ncbi:MAG: hypothetical protein ACK55R_09035, partial [Cyanobacteriota bacterium]